MVYVKLFNKGVVPTSTTTVYTVLAGKAAILKDMRFVNIGASAATLTAYFKRGSTAIRILDKDKLISGTPNGLVAVDDELCLEAIRDFHVLQRFLGRKPSGKRGTTAPETNGQ